jgi:hypothetical protein
MKILLFLKVFPDTLTTHLDYLAKKPSISRLENNEIVVI